MSKKELINDIAVALTGYGYDVYIAGSGEHGFYTDGNRVVSFGGSWNFSVDFSGNYRSDMPGQTGTGWSIASEQGVPTKEEADRYINQLAQAWSVGSAKIIYDTPDRHLATYGKSSGFSKFEPSQSMRMRP